MNTNQLKPPAELRKSIISLIGREECRRARVRLAVSTFTFFASVTGLVFSTKFLLQVFYGSEFYSYFSLIFSDLDTVLGIWQSVIMSLTESLPVITVIALLVAVWSLLSSIYIMARNFKYAVNPLFSSN